MVTRNLSSKEKIIKKEDGIGMFVKQACANKNEMLKRHMVYDIVLTEQ